MSTSKSVRLFLADGTSGGLITAEIMNWTGHVVAAPRSDLPALLKRDEASRTGVYLLLGEDPNSPGAQRAYIGEGDDVGKRIYSHARDESGGGKDFWDRVIVLTSKDMNLTKAHARYLESRFIAIATDARRATLLNGTAPVPSGLPESDVSDMEYYIAQSQIVLPVLGVNLLRSTAPASSATEGGPPSSPVFVLNNSYGADAVAQEVDGEFIVRANSRARLNWTGVHMSYRKLRDRLEAEGALKATKDGKAMYFPSDHVFASPSAAAAVVLGRSANGRLEWRARDTKITFSDWQNSLLKDVSDGGV